ncbi:MAG: translocation/assembly module TamB domain-containing protein [Hyphomonadaceae bacterium]
MSGERPRRRKRWRALAAGGVIVAGAGAWAIGPGAAFVVDHLADGARVWRLGRIRVDDVSGAWLGALHAGAVSIADNEGVWIEGRDVALRWSPLDILFGRVALHSGSAASIDLLRQPHLLERRPASDTMFDVRLEALTIERLRVGEPVLGASAEFAADSALRLQDADIRQLALTLRRLDSDDDRLIARYDAAAPASLQLDLESAPGGVIARLLGVAESGARASASGDGGADTGSAHFDATAGDAQILTGAVEWTRSQWRIDGEVHLDALPALAGLAHRIGASVSASLTGARGGGGFEAHGETPYLAVNVNGRLDARHHLDGPARIVAESARLSAIARESPFSLGAARLEGELRQARGTTALRGTLSAQDIEALGRRVQFTGPVEAALTREMFSLNADLTAAPDSPALFANARLQTTLEYNRSRGRFELNQAELAGNAIAVSAQGWVNGGDGEFSGDWRIRRMQAISPDLTGTATGHWRAFRESTAQGRVWTVTADGIGASLAGEPAIVPQLLGAAPRFDGRFRYEDGGITISHARLDGARLRAGALGRIVRGQADIALEASARGPLSLGGAEIAGAADATGRLGGPIARPSLTARAQISSFSTGAIVVERPILEFSLAPQGGAYAGHAHVEGAASGQALTGGAQVAITGRAVALGGLDASWGGLQAQGDAEFASNGASANLDVNGNLDGLAPGISGRVAGALTLTPDALAFNANLADARAGDLRVRAADVRAQGPLDALAMQFSMRGRLRQAPLTFAGTALVDASSGARIEGRGALADAPVYTRAPIEAHWRRGQTDATLNVALDGGVVRGQWQERGRALSGSAQIDDAPLAPLAAIWGETATGRIDGHVRLANDGRGLNGDANITLAGARFAGRQRGTLDMRIVGDLTPGRLAAEIDAASESGLTAHFEADAPVETSAAPLRIALARERRGRASWSVHGPAESLWAAARLPDQSLAGALDGQGELQFGAGYLSGAGHVEITDGRFEDKLTGVTLTNLDARIAIGDNGIAIERFSAAGAHGGQLTATGGSISQTQGEVAVNFSNMRVIDRPDARAQANGALTLTWEGLHSSLNGSIDIVNANLDIAANPQAGIPTLDVIEINQPGGEDFTPEETPAPRHNGSTTLDVAVRAPGRVFTRGRGVDAEWSLDMRLGGTARTPQVYGTATALRGALALSGQPFDIENATITFDGDPLDARIDMSATRDTADLTARIRLTGTARDPEISFSSEPPLPEDEILPQVLFGRSIEDLSPFEAAQLAASLAALSGQASLDLVDAARAAAGLDRFNVRQDEDGGFLVAGGVYLTRDVYVELARSGLGQPQSTVEWTVRPRLVLITSFLGNGDQRVSLRWRRETD